MKRARRRPKGEPTRLADLVQTTEAGRAARERALSRKAWEEVAGVGFARRTKPLRIHRGTLYVEVSSSGWAQELALAERVIVERLRARGVEVDRLRASVRDVEPPERGGVYAPAREQVDRARKVDVPDDVARSLAKVRDAGLREAIAKAARAAARKKAEVDVRDEAAKVKRAIPRVPGVRNGGKT